MLRNRLKLVLFCTAQLVVTGCMQRSVAKNGAFQTSTAVQQKSPLSLSDYIRTVYRVSEENTVEAEERRKKVLESNPELAQLAARVAADSKDFQSRNRLAEGYVREGLLWNAYHLFQESRTLLYGNFDAEIGLAQIWDSWSDYSLARQHATAALDINPVSASAHELMGRIHLHRNATEDAVAEFKVAADLAPERATAVANLGYAYLLTGKFPEAKATLTKALALDPNMPEARNNLGIVLAQMGEYDASIAELQKVGGPEVALNNLGAVLLSQQRPAEAAQAFQQALEGNPNYSKAAENLAATRALAAPPSAVNLPSFNVAGVEIKRPAVVSTTPHTPVQAEAAAAPQPAPVIAPVIPPPAPVEAARRAAEPSTKAPLTLPVVAAPVAPAPVTKPVDAPAVKPAAVENKTVASAPAAKPANPQPAKPESKPVKPGDAASATKPEAAPAAVPEPKHEESSAVAVASAEPQPPAAGPTAVPTSNATTIYLALAGLGVVVAGFLGFKALAGLRTKRALKRAFSR